jgi:hypothetical protein
MLRAAPALRCPKQSVEKAVLPIRQRPVLLLSHASAGATKLCTEAFFLLRLLGRRRQRGLGGAAWGGGPHRAANQYPTAATDAMQQGAGRPPAACTCPRVDARGVWPRAGGHAPHTSPAGEGHALMPQAPAHPPTPIIFPRAPTPQLVGDAGGERLMAQNELLVRGEQALHVALQEGEEGGEGEEVGEERSVSVCVRKGWASYFLGSCWPLS